MKYIVDVQGFKMPNNQFVFKKVALLPIQDDCLPTVMLFKPPHPWEELPPKYQSENRWLELNYHGILWKSGRIWYMHLPGVLNSYLKDAEIYVKGLEKTQWLRDILPTTIIFNLEHWKCPSLKKLPIEDLSCTHHVAWISQPSCAYQNSTETVVVSTEEDARFLNVQLI